MLDLQLRFSGNYVTLHIGNICDHNCVKITYLVH